MHFRYFAPSPPLAPFISHYWLLESDPGDGNIGERVVPTGHIEMMFHYRKPFVVHDPLGVITYQPKSMVSGLTGKWCDAVTQGDSGVLAVAFFPFSACRFFRFPLTEIEEKSIALNDLFSYEIHHLEEQLGEAVGQNHRLAIIEQFLLSKLLPDPGYDFFLIRQTIQRIKQYQAQVSVTSLAAEMAVTPRTLERKFASLVGKSPKQYLRIARFLETIKGLGKARGEALTQHACQNGYFDQAHLIHDFRDLSGYTPTEFLNSCNQDNTIEEITG
ncbi:MAG TPA: hypothetical protein DEO70_02825 [Bacteroidales bacterium]|nr:MAG: hypothetical protein A2X11_14225 [Bacteroidetes bacterium GWE2_42_24]OFY30012.1 MAG: hypothetical protein A2X09_14375 [Bacteroidetes bacterium GWF2_43_11]PKP27648.1 MAG: hypothetical protein CVU06_01425 [Bacteroidetes bacterium HGW-Bacteroidetes-22]HBZ65743.1 hypothetical protein [Bacteroidales bacterium]